MIDNRYYVIQINEKTYLKEFNKEIDKIELIANENGAYIFDIDIAREFNDWIKKTFNFDSNVVEITIETITHKKIVE